MNLIQFIKNKNYKTDKINGHTYIEQYSNLFKDKQLDNLNILEIGIAKGDSIKLWKDYFKNSTIYGIDISNTLSSEYTDEFEKDNNVKLFFFDGTDNKNHKEIFKDIKFDIIIEDASHEYWDSISIFDLYINNLKKNGIYIIEDVGGGKSETFLYSLTVKKRYRSQKIKEIIRSKDKKKIEEVNKSKLMSYEERRKFLIDYANLSQKKIIKHIKNKYNNIFNINTYVNLKNEKHIDDRMIIIKYL